MAPALGPPDDHRHGHGSGRAAQPRPCPVARRRSQRRDRRTHRLASHPGPGRARAAARRDRAQQVAARGLGGGPHPGLRVSQRPARRRLYPGDGEAGRGARLRFRVHLAPRLRLLERAAPRALSPPHAHGHLRGGARAPALVLVETVMARICVITAGHLATCPRMLKAADTLAAAGDSGRLVAPGHVDWAVAADADVRRRRPDAWGWMEVDYSRATAPLARLRGGARYHLARRLSALLGPARASMPLVLRGYARTHPELVRAALSAPADLFYGGTTGAIGATAEAGRRAGVPFALDLEDFHSAEQAGGADTALGHGLAERIEKDVLPEAQVLTTSSVAIAAAYGNKYGVHPVIVHNTFT